MYRPEPFTVDDPRTLQDFVRVHPFGILVSDGGGDRGATGPRGLVASHVPFRLDASPGTPGVLFGHVARANPQRNDLEEGREVLVIFSGPHAYVSPTWMDPEANVPTWNYVAVHVYGRPTVIADPVRLRREMDRFVAVHESARESPWSADVPPPDFIDRMLRGIVGFEIAIDRMEGKWKLSQNKSERERLGAIQGLEADAAAGSLELARWMRESRAF